MGPTQTQTRQMGQSPIKKFEQILTKINFPNPFFKNPQINET